MQVLTHPVETTPAWIQIIKPKRLKLNGALRGHENVSLVEGNVSLHRLNSWALTWRALVDTCSKGVSTFTVCSHAPAHRTSVNPSSHSLTQVSSRGGKRSALCPLQYNNALLMSCKIKQGYTGDSRSKESRRATCLSHSGGSELKIILIISNHRPYSTAFMPIYSGYNLDN